MPARGTNAGDRVTLLYHAFELTHAAVQPLLMQSDALRYFCRSAFSPVAYTPLGKTMAAACEVFENVTRRYRKPDWNIDEVSISGHAVPVEPEVVRSRLFCALLPFKRGDERTSDVLGKSGSVRVYIGGGRIVKKN